MTFFYLAPWIVFLPVIGLLVNAFVGQRFSEKVIGIIASLASGLPFLISILNCSSTGSSALILCR